MEDTTQEITLSPEQQALFEIMESTGQHLFITGRAGTGKSVLLRYLREHTKKKIVVVAPTGIAALNVRGQTIHSLFKINPKEAPHSKGILPRNQRVCSLLRRVEAIVIDEISMVRADLLDAINKRLQEAFETDDPFGGLQIIMFGDVYQLPPVVEEGLVPYFEHVHGGYFFFNALVWKHAEFKIYELSQVFRQKDPVFKGILNAVREGTQTDDQIAQLNERYGVPIPLEGTITLAATNALVTQINERKLDQLPEELHEYQAVITGEMKKGSFPTEEKLQLKVGAQVVMLKNDKDGCWVNGTVGKIANLEDDVVEVDIKGIVYALERETWDEIVYDYDYDSGKVESKEVSSFTQFPLRLAWAMTIHKSQGQTYESVALDLTTATFAPGQLYVALSRCTSLEGLYLKMPVKRGHIITEPKVVTFMSQKAAIIPFTPGPVEELKLKDFFEEHPHISREEVELAEQISSYAELAEEFSTPPVVEKDLFTVLEEIEKKQEQQKTRKARKKTGRYTQVHSLSLKKPVITFLETLDNQSQFVNDLIVSSEKYTRWLETFEGYGAHMGAIAEEMLNSEL